MARRKRLADFMPAGLRDVVRNSVRKMHHRYHIRAMNELVSGKTGNLDAITAFLRKRAVPLNLPLVLISQVQRSGGSLLSQLFDSHPALAAYPHELRFGFSQPDEWPPLNPRLGADENFQLMFDLKLSRLIRRGYVKGGDRIFSSDKGQLVKRRIPYFRFFLVSRVQYLVFKQLFESKPPKSSRDIFNYFFTGFFNAWLDYQGDLNDKKCITAFAPRLVNDEARAAAFFATYPDGRLIQIIRDPKTWLPSAKNHRKSILDGEKTSDLITMWIESAESMLRNKERYGDRVIILSFERLVGNTEQTMRRLASELGINYVSVLIEPTFNGNRIQANSSFGIDQSEDAEQSGINEAPLSRAAALSTQERQFIDRRCMALYDKVVAKGLNTRPAAQLVESK